MQPYLSQLGAINFTDPWTEQVTNITVNWLADVMSQLPNGDIPTSMYEDLFKKLFSVTPDAAVSPEVASLLTQPLVSSPDSSNSFNTVILFQFETMSLIPGLSSYLCKMTYWESMVAKLGIDPTKAKNALCGSTEQYWYDNLLNEGISNEEIQTIVQAVSDPTIVYSCWTLGYFLRQMREWTNGAFPTLNVSVNIPPLKDFAENSAAAITNLLTALNLTDQVDLTSLQIQMLSQQLIEISMSNLTMEEK
jgi:hypothetical protein